MKHQQIGIGVDIGGSHISSAAVDLETGIIVPGTYQQEKVYNQAVADEIINKWAACILASMQKISPDSPKGIGFAMPGPFDYFNGISLIQGVAKFESLFGMNIGNLIREATNLDNQKAIRFVNDASAFAIGEAWAGSAAGIHRSVAVTLGTGFGSAFMVEGIPQTIGNDIPENGWVYNLPFQESIADECFSTRWFLIRYEQITGLKMTGVAEIAEKERRNGHETGIFQEFGNNLAQFLSPLLLRFQADMLVIGGNISQSYDIFGHDLLQGFLTQGVKTKIAISFLKDAAALIGSARLLDDDFWQHLNSK